MRFTNLVAIGALTVVLGGGQSLLAADKFFGREGHIEIRYDDRGRNGYDNGDLRRDYQRVEELREEIRRDRFRLDCHIREGRRFLASDDARELARDEGALNQLLAHIERDREAMYRNNRYNDRDRRYDDRDGRFNAPVGSGYRR